MKKFFKVLAAVLVVAFISVIPLFLRTASNEVISGDRPLSVTACFYLIIFAERFKAFSMTVSIL